MKKVFKCILLSSILFLMVDNVYAAIVPKSYNIVSKSSTDPLNNATTLSSSSTSTFSAGSYYFFRNFGEAGVEEEQYTNIISLCSNSNDIELKKSVSSDPYILSLKVENTNKKCTLAGTSTEGTQINLTINSFRQSKTGNYDHPQMTITFGSSTKLSLINSSYQTYTSFLVEEQIKQDQTCRDSNNLFPNEKVNVSSDNLTNNYVKYDLNLGKNTEYTLSADFSQLESVAKVTIMARDSSVPLTLSSISSTSKSGKLNLTFTSPSDGVVEIRFYSNHNGDSVSTSTEYSNIMLNKGTSSLSYEPYGKEVCKNKQDITNDKLDNLNQSITSEEGPSLDSLENTAGWLPPGPIDSILNLPLTFFNSLTNNLGKSCTPINLPLPYVNKDLTLPCLNTIYDNLGITSFINVIGAIVGALILYSYLLKLYQWVDNTLQFNSNASSLDNWGGV